MTSWSPLQLSFSVSVLSLQEEINKYNVQEQFQIAHQFEAHISVSSNSVLIFYQKNSSEQCISHRSAIALATALYI